MKDTDAAEELERSIKTDDSAENLIKVVGDVIIHTKEDGTYDDWMQGAFESAEIVNDETEALNHEYHLIRKAAWLAVFQIFYIFLYFENLRFPFGIWDMAFLLNCL